MPPANRQSEERFRETVRAMLKRGSYPDNNSMRAALGMTSTNPRSGLTPNQSRWRAEEVRLAGYDWLASSKARRLVRK